jgi:hypothetical protein
MSYSDSQQTAIISLNTNQFIFVTDIRYIICKAGTDPLTPSLHAAQSFLRRSQFLI